MTCAIQKFNINLIVGHAGYRNLEIVAGTEYLPPPFWYWRTLALHNIYHCRRKLFPAKPAQMTSCCFCSSFSSIPYARKGMCPPKILIPYLQRCLQLFSLWPSKLTTKTYNSLKGIKPVTACCHIDITKVIVWEGLPCCWEYIPCELRKRHSLCGWVVKCKVS